MRRREFVALLGAAAAWPFAAHGQQSSKLPKVGFLGANTEAAQRTWTAAFLQRLAELGWSEGRTVALAYRWAGGGHERSAELLAELIALEPDVILTHATGNVVAAKRATLTIPVVFAVAGDPVGNGLVASLARPGGNITGLSLQQSELAGKRLELLRDVVPGLRRAGTMPTVNPTLPLETRGFQAAATALGIEVEVAQIRRAEDIAPAIEALKGAQALYVPQAPLVNVNRLQINELALGARLPTIYSAREMVQAGGLLSYAPNFLELFRRAAEYVDKILRGAKPAELPVEQPTKFDLVVNLRTATALGLASSPTLLARADEVIE